LIKSARVREKQSIFDANYANGRELKTGSDGKMKFAIISVIRVKFLDILLIGMNGREKAQEAQNGESELVNHG